MGIFSPSGVTELTTGTKYLRAFRMEHDPETFTYILWLKYRNHEGFRLKREYKIHQMSESDMESHEIIHYILDTYEFDGTANDRDAFNALWSHHCGAEEGSRITEELRKI